MASSARGGKKGLETGTLIGIGAEDRVNVLTPIYLNSSTSVSAGLNKRSQRVSGRHSKSTASAKCSQPISITAPPIPFFPSTFEANSMNQNHSIDTRGSSVHPELDMDDGDEPLSPVPSAADDHLGDGSGGKAAGKSGRKKSAPGSQAARRDQNRIAQREFRLRKQQRIRDLEARVEILSEGQDEAYAQLRDVIRDLMDENTALRGLLRDLAGFIGEGIGGTLKPRTGWDPVKFREFCDRGETDTAYEGWLARKRGRGSVPQGAGVAGSEHADDEHDDPSGSRKRRRGTRKDSELDRPFGPSPVGASDMGSSDPVPSDISLPRPHLDGLDIDWSTTGLAIPQSNPNARSRKDLERPPSTSSAATNSTPFPDSFSSSFPGSNTSFPGQSQTATRHSPATTQGGPGGVNPSPGGGSMSSFPAISPQMSSTRTRLRHSIDTTPGADILPPLPSISTLGPPPLDVGSGGLSVGIGVGVNIGGSGQPGSLFQHPAPAYGAPPQISGSYGPTTSVGSGRPMSSGGPQQSVYYTIHPGGASGAAGTESQTLNPPPPVADDFGEADPQLREAGALIKYHIDNYRRSDNYHLPPSLRPTLTQRTVQHNGVIDGLIFPAMRDRAILLSGRFDLAECFADLMRAVIIHGDDVLAHGNWEISINWMKRYHFLVDETILSDSINPWRRKRGERELTMQDIQPSTSEYSESNK
ncbi:bZIP transcription factor [Rhizoctonia solani 123E]|uniref:BZIP transcription factor n=1 Tax=Rhizoctonia solani 123E TaxID=1423351 RepID=A0A074S323_9AGAM|nr:bZIP transcription factor [Rhizoctonia solani 123E]